MEGKRVKYKVPDFDVKCDTDISLFPINKMTIENFIWKEKFGTIVGLFECGKVCVKCDEDKLLRLFKIEELEIIWQIKK